MMLNKFILVEGKAGKSRNEKISKEATRVSKKMKKEFSEMFVDL